jgi:hypothetical protein
VSESLNHTALLNRLIGYVRHAMDGDQHLLILHDLPGLLGCEKPPMIEGFRPDLYATSGALQGVIIGEAKTADDLETAHSREQYRAYARHLAASARARPTFILAVPWQLRVRAKTLMRLAVEEAGAPAIVRIVIDDVQELQP